MKKAIIGLVGVLLLGMGASLAQGQVWEEWVARYNQNSIDEGDFVAVSNAGEVFVAGLTTPGGGIGSDYLLVKFDQDGNYEWSQNFSGAGNSDDYITGLVVDAEGNPCVTGTTWETSQCRTIKYGNDGQILWSVLYPPVGSFHSGLMTIDSEGNIYIGQAGGICIIKYDPYGRFQWSAAYSGPTAGLVTGMATDAGGNAYITGYMNYNWREWNTITLKFDAAGNQLWAAIYDNYDWDQAYDLAVDLNGNVYVTGVSGGSSVDDGCFTIKYDSLGNEEWMALYDSPGNYTDHGLVITTDAEANVLVAGTTGVTSYDDILIIKYSTNGAIQWVRNYSLSSNTQDWPIGIKTDSNGDVYVGGANLIHGYVNYPQDYVAIKYSATGSTLWIKTYDYSGATCEAKDMALDEEGNFYIAGNCETVTSWNDDMVAVKFTQTPPSVIVTLTPITNPIVIPVSGGSFQYNLNLLNNTTSQQSFAAWIMVQTPNNTWYGPIVGPFTMSLPAGGSLTRLRVQNVPGGASPGSYLYEARAGLYPDSIYHRDSFAFTKSGMGDGTLDLEQWSSSGSSFPGEELVNSDVIHNSSLIIHNSPNPFNPSTVASYELRVPSYVSLKVYDTAGRLVATLVDGWREAGEHRATFDGSGLAAGVYLYRLTAGEQTASGKMVLLK